MPLVSGFSFVAPLAFFVLLTGADGKVYLNRNCECGVRSEPEVPHDVDHRIINGEHAGVHEFPWVVGLLARRRSAPFCGGSLISNYHVVTAAHCLDRGLVARYAAVGDHDTRTEHFDRSKAIAVKPYKLTDVVHPQYSAKTATHDIAVLELRYAVGLGPAARTAAAPVCFPDNKAPPVESGAAWIAGWGNTANAAEEGRDSTSPILMKAEVPILQNEVCEAAFKDIGVQHLCAGGLGMDTCSGDSGGPLMARRQRTRGGAPERYELLGITSYGPKSGCGSDIPGVYVRFSRMLPFVVKQMTKTRRPVQVCRGILPKWN